MSLAGANLVTRAPVVYADDDLAVALVTNLGYTLAASAINQHISPRLLGLPAPESLDLPLGIAERARYLGVYDAGGFWYEIPEDGERLTFDMHEPGFSDEACVTFALRSSIEEKSLRRRT